MSPQVFVPFSGGVRRPDDLDPASAASIMRNAMDVGFDPVKLAGLRTSRQSELERQMAGDVGAGDVEDFHRHRMILGDLDQDMADDPYTGTAARARVGGIEHALDTAETTTRSEVGDAANTVASRNAFAKFLQDRAGYGAQTSPEGSAALDAASRRKIGENVAASTGRSPWDKPFNPSAKGKSQLEALNQIEVLGPRIMSRLEEKYPGIADDPTKFGGAMAAGQAHLQKLGYLFGIDSRDDDIKQYIQLMKAIGVTPYMSGMRNRQVYEDIAAHTGDMGFSPGADYSRVKTLLDPSMIAELRQAILSGEAPIDPRTGQQGFRRPGTLPPGVTVQREP